MSFSRKKRFQIFERDHFTCRYCGSQAPQVPLRVDHILAISRGGTDNDSNLVTACQDCNSGKGELLLPLKGYFFHSNAEVLRESLRIWEDVVSCADDHCLDDELMVGAFPECFYNDHPLPDVDLAHDWRRIADGIPGPTTEHQTIYIPPELEPWQ